MMAFEKLVAKIAIENVFLSILKQVYVSEKGFISL